jgi:dipeptidyl-peptidase-3
MWGDIEDHKES